MPTPAKVSDNQAKHRTKQEVAARKAAEASATPRRERVKLRKPQFVRADPQADKYWVAILAELRMGGAELLDNLDSEVFAGYCSLLAMRDRVAMVTPGLLDVTAQVMSQARKIRLDPEDTASAEALAAVLEQAGGLLKTCGQLSDKRNKLDNTILSYAEKLGLTPSGRARLAVKRAADPAEELGDMAALLPFVL